MQMLVKSLGKESGVLEGQGFWEWPLPVALALPFIASRDRWNLGDFSYDAGNRGAISMLDSTFCLAIT